MTYRIEIHLVETYMEGNEVHVIDADLPDLKHAVDKVAALQGGAWVEFRSAGQVIAVPREQVRKIVAVEKDERTMEEQITAAYGHHRSL